MLSRGDPAWLSAKMARRYESREDRDGSGHEPRDELDHHRRCRERVRRGARAVCRAVRPGARSLPPQALAATSAYIDRSTTRYKRSSSSASSTAACSTGRRRTDPAASVRSSTASCATPRCASNGRTTRTRNTAGRNGLDPDRVDSDDTTLSQVFDRAWARSIVQEASPSQPRTGAIVRLAGDAARRDPAAALRRGTADPRDRERSST